MTSSAARREAMVAEQIAGRGIRDPAVLAAFRAVPREAFVAPELAELAYDDAPLPIDEGQTISQPYVVALMIEAARLAPGDRALEIGTGSGYSAALLSHIVSAVYTVERSAWLAELAGARLARLGYRNVHVRQGDGTLGWPEQAPYDAILVAAGSPRVPPALLEQLAVRGRLLIPVGPGPGAQELLRITREGPSALQQEALGEVRFVPLIGAAGWEPSGWRATRRRKEADGEDVV
jgi:protein-L-isoaspartate(D-aspartate) O-methyltransferase